MIMDWVVQTTQGVYYWAIQNWRTMQHNLGQIKLEQDKITTKFSATKSNLLQFLVLWVKLVILTVIMLLCSSVTFSNSRILPHSPLKYWASKFKCIHVNFTKWQSFTVWLNQPRPTDKITCILCNYYYQMKIKLHWMFISDRFSQIMELIKLCTAAAINLWPFLLFAHSKLNWSNYLQEFSWFSLGQIIVTL